MKHKLIVIFPSYPTLQTIISYDIILGLQCLNYDVYFIVLEKENYKEHTYFKNKCSIFYLDEIIKKLKVTHYIIYGIQFLVSSFYISIFSLFYILLKKPTIFTRAIALLKFKHEQKLRRPISIFCQSSYIISSLYGIFLKRVIPQCKIVLDIQSYYSVTTLKDIKGISNWHQQLSPKRLFTFRYVIQNVDLICSIIPDIYPYIVTMFRRYYLNTSFLFSVHEIPIAITSIGNKIYNPTLLKVVFVSYFHKIKAIKEALQEIKELLLRNNNIQVCIVGDGEERQKIEEYLVSNGLTSKVNLCGAKDRIDTLKLIKEADILIHNSYSEGGPIVLFEAFMCQTIPIIRATGMAKYCVKNGYNGFIIDDTNTLYSILDKILKNPEILLQMRSNISIKYKTNANFGSIIKKIHYSIQNLYIPHPYSKIKL